MKNLAFVFGLLFFTNLNARTESDNLQVVKDGLVIVIVNFKEGDKIKLFEVETGDHILSKTRGQIDLSQLPSGKYLLENNYGSSTVIEKTEFEIVVEEVLGMDYMVDVDSESMSSNLTTVEEELENYYYISEKDPLFITRDGDLITVTDFQEGDKIKLFELKNIVHILSKTVGTVDLSQLPVGKYVLENNKGQSVVVEKIETEEEEYAVAYN
ncbi:hypothetical protein [Aquimarina sp. RZ0]|uniref:hypothetical protein n=1 Tax=Aquimarina sp. RZ0 TaxID=2607730 RepID=UPI0011F0F235|nr:hypothetical protein [Aquimarina sp. RZ0]KAA1246661.1 hypothetical protein F0000_06355 [Aquimarina sp. RZ0]